MIVAVQGTNDFDQYSVFLRAMSVALSSMQKDDNEFIIYSAGSKNINSFAMEFVNVSEHGMKRRKMKIKLYKVAPSWVEENIQYINYFAFLSKPNQHPSKLVATAQLNNVEVGIFRY
jgi:hypothetical protein